MDFLVKLSMYTDAVQHLGLSPNLKPQLDVDSYILF